MAVARWLDVSVRIEKEANDVNSGDDEGERRREFLDCLLADPEACRSASRYGSSAKLNIKDPQLPQSPHWLSDGFWVGFRVVAPVKEPPEAEKVKYWDADDPTTLDILKRDRELREVIDPPKPVAGAAGK